MEASQDKSLKGIIRPLPLVLASNYYFNLFSISFNLLISNWCKAKAMVSLRTTFRVITLVCNESLCFPNSNVKILIPYVMVLGGEGP